MQQGNQQQGNQQQGAPSGVYDSAVEMVKRFLRDCDLDPDNCLDSDDEDGAVWTCESGSAHILIMVLKDDEDPEDIPLISVVSPIVSLTDDPELVEPCLRYCMEYNRFSRVTLGMSDDESIVVRTCRTLDGLDQEEVEEMVLTVAGVADTQDNILATEYGCTMIGEE